MRLKPQHVALPVWVVAPDGGAESPTLREECAVTLGTRHYGYMLSVFELKDNSLKTQPFEVPKYGWVIEICTEDKSMTLFDGVAPSYEEARQRVEACWRVAMNAIADG